MCAFSFALCTAIEDLDLSRILIYVGAFYVARYLHCVFGPRIIISPLIRAYRRINPYHPAELRVQFRFEKRHAHALTNCLGFIQLDIVCDNGAYCISEEAFLILLFRMTSYKLFSDVESHFGIDFSMLCRIFNTCVEQVVVDNYHLLYDNLDYFVTRYELYNTAFEQKLFKGAWYCLSLLLMQLTLQTASRCI